jgi:HSP20 family protein
MVTTELERKQENKPSAQIEPFRSFASLRNNIDRWFDDLFEGRGMMLGPMPGEWRPAVDINETDKEIVISASIPGVKKDELSVEVSEDMLTISGERHQESEHKTANTLRREQSYGSFYRAFKLPSNVKADQIQASYNNGILEVHLPKAAVPQPKTKKVMIAG